MDAARELLVELEDLPDLAVLPVRSLGAGVLQRQAVLVGPLALAAGLASQIGRRTRARVISVGYRLAPEDPYPAAVDDALAAYEALLRGGTAPSDIALAGESAGGGLAIATLVNARDHGLPLPTSCHRMPTSPWQARR